MKTSIIQIETAERDLLASIDAALAESKRKGGDWLACRPGCTDCCKGPFAITELDAHRLQQGLESLTQSDPARADAIRTRTDAYLRIVEPLYPGDPETGELYDEDALPEQLEDLPCPILDPVTGHCDLYTARPITCRTFGPATHYDGDSYAHCELCYTTATPEQIQSCAVEMDPDGKEQSLLTALDASKLTIVAYAIAK